MSEAPSPLLTFVQISDTHLYLDPEQVTDFIPFSPLPGTNAVIDAVNALPFPIDFVLHTGDVMTDPENAEDYQYAVQLLSRLNAPVYYMPGNHDRTDGMRQYLMPGHVFPSDSQFYYAFEVNGVQIVMLDSHIPRTGHGIISDEQFEWLAEICTPSDPRPLVVALHHHPIELGVPWFDTLALRNGQTLHNRLSQVRDRLRGVFYGHIHQNTATMRDGISYFSCLSSWYQLRSWHGQKQPHKDPVQQPGFNVVTVTADDLIVQRYLVPFDPSDAV